MASMSFREKSAWAMMAVMLLSGLLYFNTVSADPGAPVVVALVPYVLVLVVASVLVQVMLAIAAPREANSPVDERERLVVNVHTAYRHLDPTTPGPDVIELFRQMATYR